MKKHAKKSLLVPILALVSAIAIAAFCYLAQSFSAFAEEEPVLEPAITSEDGAASAAEEAELGQANPSGNSIMARIHFSTDDIMTGNIESLDGTTTPFWPTTILTHEFILQDEFSSISCGDVDEDTVEIRLLNSSDTPISDIINVRLPWHKDLLNSSMYLNWVDDYSVDITINIALTYDICFDANGGKFSDTGLPYVFQKETEGYFMLQPPSDPDSLTAPSSNFRFVGWFTERFGGEEVFMMGTQVPEFGTYFVLYAHWAWTANPDQAININLFSENIFQQFNYQLTIEGVLKGTDNTSFTSLFDLYRQYDIDSDYWLNGSNFIGINYSNTTYGIPNITVYWGGNSALWIKAKEGQHINWATFNGSIISNCSYTGIRGLDNFNNLVISTGVNMPSYISVTSDNGSLFKCRTLDSSLLNVQEYVTDYMPIFINADEKVSYYYGKIQDYLNNNLLCRINEQDEFIDTNGISLVIEVIKDGGGGVRYFVFSDNLFTLFDWFDINTYIKGVSLDDKLVLAGFYDHVLEWGNHNFTLRMSDHVADTSVTYNANGGAFADGSDSMTFDATYGEALPMVENPTLAENDFVGWFTEPEGGVQVDPENFHWMPWQKWEGVTLYAHWAYNPQPVPPEPVPPTPPEPINPDVPGGGGTAQTGDSMPLMPIAVLAIIATLGCAITIRKETSK